MGKRVNKATSMVHTTCKSKIEKYKLEEMAIRLREEEHLTYQEIAEKLNISGLVPSDDEIKLWTVERFLKKIPEVKKHLLHQDKRRLLKVMNKQVDIIDETLLLYNRTKTLLINMENKAAESNGTINTKSYKALCSEMRVLLKQMTEMQKQINDFENVKKFMEIVLETVHDVAPQALNPILDKLRIKQNSVWLTKKVNSMSDTEFNEVVEPKDQEEKDL